MGTLSNKDMGDPFLMAAQALKMLKGCCDRCLSPDTTCCALARALLTAPTHEGPMVWGELGRR